MSKILFFIMFVAAFAICDAAVKNPRCLQPITVGPCAAYFPRYGYDPNQNRCREFIYGGCRGNDNRFPAMEMCEYACIMQ